jgi:hypothetical protein
MMTRAFYFVAAVWIGLFLLTLVMVAQQVPRYNLVPGDRLIPWEATGSVSLIQSYRYEVEIDGQIRKDALADVQCEAVKDVVRCTALAPTMNLGGHLVRIRPVDVSVPGFPSVEGKWMPPVYYMMRPVPPDMKPAEPVKPKGTP